MPIHCKRCKSNLPGARKLECTKWSNGPRNAISSSGVHLDGITPEEISRLRSRKKSPGIHSDVMRTMAGDLLDFVSWRRYPFTMRVPSTFSCLKLGDVKCSHADSLDFEQIEESNRPYPDLRNFAHYEGFQQSELPRLVRASAEVVDRQIQPFEQTLMEMLPQLIRDCQ